MAVDLRAPFAELPRGNILTHVVDVGRLKHKVSISSLFRNLLLWPRIFSTNNRQKNDFFLITIIFSEHYSYVNIGQPKKVNCRWLVVKGNVKIEYRKH